MIRRLLLAALTILALSCASKDVPITTTHPRYMPAIPAMKITETLETWRDTARNRDIPVKIYAPAEGNGPFPLIVFSHGLGSSRQGYVYLGRAWASRGYVSIHMQHRGSDSEVLRKRGFRAIYHAAYDAQEYVDRPLDVKFVLDETERRVAKAAAGSIWSKIDLAHIGAAGHSYGAHTTLSLAGMLINFPDQPGRSFHDPRPKAALLLSIPTMSWSPTPK